MTYPNKRIPSNHDFSNKLGKLKEIKSVREYKNGLQRKDTNGSQGVEHIRFKYNFLTSIA